MCVCVCDLICKKGPLLSKDLGPDFEKYTVKHIKIAFAYI